MIELLVVMAVLMLLAVLYWGPSTTTNEEREAKKTCQNQLQNLYTALSIYANDHAGHFPQSTNAQTSGEALDALVPHYAADTTLFICPGSKDTPVPAGQSLRQHKISYAYYMGRSPGDGRAALMSDAQVDTRSKIAGDYAFSKTGRPPANNHQKLGGNFLFCDGSATATPPQLPFSVTLTQGVILLNPSAP
jgi:prepilin-type processing-associated H-X9-DG protein